MVAGVQGSGDIFCLSASAVFKLPGCKGMYHNVHIGELAGNVGDKSHSVNTGGKESRFKLLLYVIAPIGVNPSVRLRGGRYILRHIGAVPVMDGNAVSSGYKSDNFIAGQRIAALGEFDKAVVYALYYYAVAALFLLLGNYLNLRILFRLEDFIVFLFYL